MAEEYKTKSIYSKNSDFAVKSYSIKNVFCYGSAYKQRQVWVSHLQDRTEDIKNLISKFIQYSKSISFNYINVSIRQLNIRWILSLSVFHLTYLILARATKK